MDEDAEKDVRGQEVGVLSLLLKCAPPVPMMIMLPL